MPPQDYTIKRKRLVIDSRSRDRVAYPTPAKYEVKLAEDLFSVAAVSLVVADVPFPAYLIGAAKRAVPFSFGADPATATTATALLTVGDYATPEELATEVGRAMTAAAAAAAADAAADPVTPVTFTATHVPRTDGFEIRCSVPFAMRFTGRAADSAAGVLGFDAGGRVGDVHASSPDPEDAGAQLVVAPFRRDFRTDRYVVLKLCPNAEVLASVTQAIDRTFAIVPSTSLMNINIDEAGFEKRWTPPLSRVGRIVVQFTDGDGNAYDFQNQDHRLELLFEIVGPRAWQ